MQGLIKGSFQEDNWGRWPFLGGDIQGLKSLPWKAYLESWKFSSDITLPQGFCICHFKIHLLVNLIFRLFYPWKISCYNYVDTFTILFLNQRTFLSFPKTKKKIDIMCPVEYFKTGKISHKLEYYFPPLSFIYISLLPFDSSPLPRLHSVFLYSLKCHRVVLLLYSLWTTPSCCLKRLD